MKEGALRKLLQTELRIDLKNKSAWKAEKRRAAEEAAARLMAGEEAAGGEEGWGGHASALEDGADGAGAGSGARRPRRAAAVLARAKGREAVRSDGSGGETESDSGDEGEAGGPGAGGPAGASEAAVAAGKRRAEGGPESAGVLIGGTGQRAPGVGQGSGRGRAGGRTKGGSEDPSFVPDQDQRSEEEDADVKVEASGGAVRGGRGKRGRPPHAKGGFRGGRRRKAIVPRGESKGCVPAPGHPAWNGVC
jgi:hypothetical protein